MRVLERLARETEESMHLRVLKENIVDWIFCPVLCPVRNEDCLLSESSRTRA